MVTATPPSSPPAALAATVASGSAVPGAAGRPRPVLVDLLDRLPVGGVGGPGGPNAAAGSAARRRPVRWDLVRRTGPLAGSGGRFLRRAGRPRTPPRHQ